MKLLHGNRVDDDDDSGGIPPWFKWYNDCGPPLVVEDFLSEQ